MEIQIVARALKDIDQEVDASLERELANWRDNEISQTEMAYRQKLYQERVEILSGLPRGASNRVIDPERYHI